MSLMLFCEGVWVENINVDDWILSFTLLQKYIVTSCPVMSYKMFAILFDTKEIPMEANNT